MPNMNNIDPKKWIVTFGKSIAYTARDVVVDKIPNTSQLLGDIGSATSDGRAAVDNALSGFKDENGSITFQSIKQSSQFKSAMKVIDSAIADIKSGNIAHAAELTDIDDFGGDLGIDFGLDEETQVDSEGNETTVVAGITNDAKVTAQASIRGARAVTIGMRQLSEDFSRIFNRATKGATTATVHATIVSANMLHSDLVGINKRLDVMNTNIATLVQFGDAQSRMNEQTSTHYARMEEAFSVMMTMINDANGKSGKDDKSSALEDIVKYGFNTNTFKELVKENLARIGADSIKDIATNMFGMAKDMGMGMDSIFNLGMPIRSAIEKMLPKKTVAAIEEFDRKIPRSLNLLLSRIGDLSDRGGALGMIGQILGVRAKAGYQTDMGRYNKGATAWSGTSKKALEEVIPHYLASIDEVLHKHLAKDTSYEAAYFDYERGVFRTATQIRSDFAEKMKQKRRQIYSDSRSTIESALSQTGSTASPAQIDALKRNLDAIAVQAIESNEKSTTTMQTMRRVLADPVYGLTPEAINEIVISYQSDITKEKITLSKDMQKFMHSNEGSAFRQSQLGAQKLGHNKMYVWQNGRREAFETKDLYGMFDFYDEKNLAKVRENDDTLRSILFGDIFEESSYEKQARMQAEEQRKMAEAARKETLDAINGIIQRADVPKPFMGVLKNFKTYYENATIVPPAVDSKLASTIATASLTIDNALIGDYQYKGNQGVVKGIKDLAKQIQDDFKKNYEADQKIVRQIDFEMAIRKVKVNGVLLNPDMYDIHVKGSGANPAFDYAKLWDTNIYVGYPYLIKANDIDPVRQVINTNTVKYVTEDDYRKQEAKENGETSTDAGLGAVDRRRKKRENRKKREARKKAKIAQENSGYGWIGHGRYGRLIGRAGEGSPEAADTNATKRKKWFWELDPKQSEFALKDENKSIFKEMNEAWHKVMGRLGGSDVVKQKAAGAMKGAAIGGLMGGLGLSLGPFFMPGGPIGGALIGAAAGILTSRVDFKKILFGEKVVNEKGEVVGIKKTGLVGQWANTVRSALIDNMVSEVRSVGSEIRAYWNKTMVPELEDLFHERNVKLAHAMDKLIGAIGGAANIMIHPVKTFNNMMNRLAYTALDTGVKATGFLLRNAGKIAVQGLTAPVKLFNAARNYADYGFTRMAVQGTRNKVRGLVSRAAYVMSPWEWARGRTYGKYREEKFGSGVRMTDDGHIDNSDLERKVERQLAAWDRRRENKRLMREDYNTWIEEREKEKQRLWDNTAGVRANRDFKLANWNKNTSRILGNEGYKDAVQQRKENRRYRNLVSKYVRQDAGQFKKLDTATARKRYAKLKKHIQSQPKEIQDAFAKIDKNSPEDIENFILNPKAFIKMKTAQENEGKKDNALIYGIGNMQSLLASILNTLTGGKFKGKVTSEKPARVPFYGNNPDETDDGTDHEEAVIADTTDEEEEGSGIGYRVGRVVRGVKSGYRTAKNVVSGVRTAYKVGKTVHGMYKDYKMSRAIALEKRMIQDENPNVKFTDAELESLAQERLNRGYKTSRTKFDAFSDRATKLRALGISTLDVDVNDVTGLDNLAARSGLKWDSNLRDYVSRAGHGRKRARYVPNRPIGHGFLQSAMSLGGKVLGGLKKAGGVAWSGIKKAAGAVASGAKAVGNFLMNTDGTMTGSDGSVYMTDSAGNMIPVESSGDATKKESNLSLSGSLKEARAGNRTGFSEGALDSNFKQNVLSGLNAMLFIMSKGAYNPGFNLSKVGDSGTLQLDNVAKKEAQYEVSVGNTITSLTETATAARTKSTKDATGALVEGMPKSATPVIMGETPRNNLGEGVVSSIVSQILKALPTILPTLLAGGGLAAIVSAVLAALGIKKSNFWDEIFGNKDEDGDRTLYTNENGEIVDKDDPGAIPTTVSNDRAKENVLSKGMWDTVASLGRYLGNKFMGTKTGQRVARVAAGAKDFLENRYLDVAVAGEKFLQNTKPGQALATFGSNVKNAVTTKIGGVKNAVTTLGTNAKNALTTFGTNAKSKVATFADDAVNIAKQVGSFAAEKAGSLKQGAKAVISSVGGKISDVASSLLGKSKATVSASTGLVSVSSAWTKICDVVQGIVDTLDNSKLKSIVGDAAADVLKFLREALTKMRGAAPDILESFRTKIMTCLDALSEKAAKNIPILGWAVSAVTGVWDLVSGWFDAANLFYVHADDVDATMRVISSLLKFLANSFPGLNIAGTVAILLGDIFGIDVMHWLATNLYNIVWGVTHLGDQSENTLDEKQAAFKSDVDAYNAANNTNVSVRAYSDQENKSLWSKVTTGASNLFTSAKNALFGNKNKESTQSGASGHGRRRRARVASSMVGHGSRRRYVRLVGHGAADQYGNVDNSMMKGKYTGMQDNGTTIQNGAYYFAQSDPAWKHEKLTGFSGSTIGGAGCVMTSAAMGASSLLNQSINPSVFNSTYGNGNTSMGTRFGDLGLTVTRYPSPNASQSSHYSYTAVKDVVYDALSKRQPVMLYGTKKKDSIYWDGGRESDAHCVLGTGLDQNGNIIVNNPSGVKAQKNFGWKKSHPFSSLGDVHWVQVMSKDGKGISGILNPNTSGYTTTGSAATTGGTSYNTPASTSGATTGEESTDPITTAWNALTSGISGLSNQLLSNLFKTNAGAQSNEQSPNPNNADTVGHGKNYRQTDPSVANLPTGDGWSMKDGGCGVATIANMISGHGSSLLKSSYSAAMGHFVDGGLTGDGMAATLYDMGYDPQSVTDTDSLNSLLARGVHVAALGAGHGSSAFPKDSAHWIDLQGYDPFTGKYTWMDPEKGLKTGNLDPSEISSAITIGHGAADQHGNVDNSMMSHRSTNSSKITAKMYSPSGLSATEFNNTIDKTSRSYGRDPNGFLWNKQGKALVEAEKNYGVNGLGLLGIAQAESGFNSSDKAIRNNNATSIMGSNGLKTYGSPAENITATGNLLGVKYKSWFNTTGTYDIAPHYCPTTAYQSSTDWANKVTDYTTRFAAIAKGGDGSSTMGIETDKGTNFSGTYQISNDVPSASIASSSSYSSTSGTNEESSTSSDGLISSALGGLSGIGNQLLSNLFKSGGHGRRKKPVGHGGAKTGGINTASMIGSGYIDDSIAGQTVDASLVTGGTVSGGVTSRSNTKIISKMDVIISLLRVMVQTAQAANKAQAGHGTKAAKTGGVKSQNTQVGHGSVKTDGSQGSLVRYRPTKTMRQNRNNAYYGMMSNLADPTGRINSDTEYLHNVHNSIATGSRKILN